MTGKLAAEIGIGNSITNKDIDNINNNQKQSRNQYLPIYGKDIQLLKERNAIASTYVYFTHITFIQAVE